jgi:predicted aspartyl protease
MPVWTLIAAPMAAAMVVPPSIPPAPDIAADTAPEANPIPSAVPGTIPGADPTDATVEGSNDRYGRMTVPVTIEGQGPFRFMIDTGAQATVVTRGLTEQLNLVPTGSATLVGMASRRPVQLVEVDGLQFADRTLNNISAPLLEARNIGADGILGLDSLQDLRVMINFRDDTIAVNDSEALGGNRGYEIVVRARHKLGRLIITRARIDGVRTAVVIDTGAQSSFGNLKLKRRLRGRDPQEVVSTDVNGQKIVGDRTYAKSLIIQDLQLNNLPITFTESPAFKALNLQDRPALILGMRDLRLFDRIAIDFATRRVLFDLPSGQRFHRGVKHKFSASRLKSPS